MQDFVVFDHVCKTYQMGDVRIEALKDASFTIDEGEICVIVGQSGAGKTTLLNILGGMDRLTSGHVLLAGEDVADYSRKRLTTYRRHEVGFVFQFYNLLPNMTALENVQIAGQLCKNPIPADEVLRQVGLGERMQNFPAQLSGGEQQRVAAARAIITAPALVLADEPTGALDSKSAGQLLGQLSQLNREQGATIVMVTHDAFTASWCHRILFIKDGRLWHELRRDGEDRRRFFQDIIGVVSRLGGDAADVL